MTDKTAFEIASACDHRGDDVCWACVVKMTEHDEAETKRAEAAEARANELEAQLAGAAQTIVTLTRERDEWRRKANESGDLSMRFEAERDEARRLLKESRNTIQDLTL